MSISLRSSNVSESSSDTDSSVNSSVYMTANSGESDNEFSPFDDTIELLASPEEVAEYEEAAAEEEHLANMLQDRFECHVDVSSW